MVDFIIFAHLGVDQQIKAVLLILIPLMIFSIKIGLFNVSGNYDKLQLLRIDFFDYLQVGFLNGHNYIDNILQIGIFNMTSNGGVQIGLLNYNENALIKWMPLVNFSFGGKEK